ncbi:MAG: hypothetical protein YK1309IOTA_260009 [Marine Group I thaumarchaeote]|nr:MAG: hypothetical protein YK1309IOTA_260009 [Marine Group I thaumarchaeote]
MGFLLIPFENFTPLPHIKFIEKFNKAELRLNHAGVDDQIPLI